MDLGPGGLDRPGPSGFGGGYDATNINNDFGGSGSNDPKNDPYLSFVKASQPRGGIQGIKDFFTGDGYDYGYQPSFKKFLNSGLGSLVLGLINPALGFANIARTRGPDIYDYLKESNFGQGVNDFSDSSTLDEFFTKRKERKFFRGGRAGYAEGSSNRDTGYSAYSSPSSSTASNPSVYESRSNSGGGDGDDRPTVVQSGPSTERPNFNFNIDERSIDPELSFKNFVGKIYLEDYLKNLIEKDEDADLKADLSFRDQFGNVNIAGNYGPSGDFLGASIPFFQSGLASLAYSPDTGLAAGLRGNLTPNLSGAASFQDGQKNANLNYNEGPFSAGVAFGPQGNDMRVGFKMPLAKGGLAYLMGL